MPKFKRKVKGQDYYLSGTYSNPVIAQEKASVLRKNTNRRVKVYGRSVYYGKAVKGKQIRGVGLFDKQTNKNHIFDMN